MARALTWRFPLCLLAMQQHGRRSCFRQGHHRAQTGGGEIRVQQNILLSTQQEASLDGILVVDEENHILSYNRRFVELWGLPPNLVEEGADEPVLQFVTAQTADPQSFLQRVQYLYEHRQATSQDEILLSDGRVFDRYSAQMLGSDDRYYGRVWYFRDITERKKIESEIRRANRLYEVLSQVNQAIVRIRSRDELLSTVCRLVVERGAIDLAWIGWLDRQDIED